MKLYICKHCGNIISYAKKNGPDVVCCGEKMKEIIPASVDAAKEKHVPVIKIDSNKVKVMVGEVEHPMTAEHYIEWILIETNKTVKIRKLQSNDKPEAEFLLQVDEEILGVYAYCNLHGLWKNN